jgi:hypothetical protein
MVGFCFFFSRWFFAQTIPARRPRAAIQRGEMPEMRPVPGGMPELRQRQKLLWRDVRQRLLSGRRQKPIEIKGHCRDIRGAFRQGLFKIPVLHGGMPDGDSDDRLDGLDEQKAKIEIECVSKWKEMQFRMDLTAFQGAFRGVASQIFDL